MQSGDPTGDSLYYPVIQGVSPPAALPSLASAATQTINPYTWGPQEGTINTWFDNNIVR
jgi:iron(III) transport system substrate-binding protein